MAGSEALERGNCRTETHRSEPQAPLPGTPLCKRCHTWALPHRQAHGLRPHTEASQPLRGAPRAKPGQGEAAASPQAGDGPLPEPAAPLPLGALGDGRAPPAQAVSCLSAAMAAPPPSGVAACRPLPGRALRSARRPPRARRGACRPLLAPSPQPRALFARPPRERLRRAGSPAPPATAPPFCRRLRQPQPVSRASQRQQKGETCSSLPSRASAATRA